MIAGEELSQRLLAAARAKGVEVPQDVLRLVQNASQDSTLMHWLTQDSHGPRLVRNPPIPISQSSGDDVAKKQRHIDAFRGDQFAKTLAALQASTEALNNQTRALKTQLRTLISHPSRETQERPVYRRQARQTQQVRLVNEGMSTELYSEIELRRTRVEKDARTLPVVIAECLKADDRRFESLLQDLNSLDVTVNLAELKERSEQLAHVLRTKRAAALKDKLDTTYLATLTGTKTEDSQSMASPVAIIDIKHDIDLLYTEIDDVMTMLVGQEHMNELRELFESVHGQGQARTKDVILKATSRIDDMNDGLTTLIKRSQATLAQRSAMPKIAAQIELCRQGAAQVTKQDGQAVTTASANHGEYCATGNIVQDIKNTQSILDTAVERRSQAINLLPVDKNDSEIAKLDVLEQRLAKAKGAFEQHTNAAP